MVPLCAESCRINGLEGLSSAIYVALCYIWAKKRAYSNRWGEFAVKFFMGQGYDRLEILQDHCRKSRTESV